MVKDTRWPATLFLIARSVQLFLAVVTLGVASYFTIYFSVWYVGYSLAVAIMTIIYICVNFGLFFNNFLLPLAIVIIEPILFVLWLVAVCAVGVGNQYTLAISCTYTAYSWRLKTFVTQSAGECHLFKGGFSAMVLEMIAMIPSIVLASIVMHKTRKDSAGRKHNALRKAGGDIGMMSVASPPVHKNMVNIQTSNYHQPNYPQYQQGIPGLQAPSHPQYQQNAPLPRHPQYSQNIPEMQAPGYPQYRQDISEMQSPVYPPQSTGTPEPYPRREYTVSPPLPAPTPSNRGNSYPYELSGYNRGNQGVYR